MPTKTKYPKFRARIGDASALRQRITAGTATADEAQHYDKILRELRRKFQNGQLSPQSAREFGID